MKKLLCTVIFAGLALVLLTPVNSFAGDANEYLDEPTGAIVKFNNDNTIKSIAASGEAVLSFGDRRDVIMAKKKAILIAKATIAKFMKERLDTEEVMDELVKTTTETGTNGDPSAIRKTLETQRTVIKNSADALLKGVVTLMSDVNHEEKYVKILIGTNERYMRAADELKGKMERDLANELENNTNPYDSFKSGSGREIKTSDALKDF